MANILDRRYRMARVWSNNELRRLARHITGDVVNVSGWRDDDKEGGHYRDYFTAASSYRLTNFRAEMRGWQGGDEEIFLDLEAPLPEELAQRFDAVFNHTVLEHVYQVQTAFANLCAMSRDLVIVVVPFLQEMHGDYGDFWRFTPSVIKRMLEDNGLTLVHSGFNNQPRASVYVLAIGSRQPERWTQMQTEFTCQDPQPLSELSSGLIGCNAIDDPLWLRVQYKLSALRRRWSQRSTG